MPDSVYRTEHCLHKNGSEEMQEAMREPISALKRMYRTGPRTEPCGKPNGVGRQDEREEQKRTLAVRSETVVPKLGFAAPQGGGKGFLGGGPRLFSFQKIFG